MRRARQKRAAPGQPRIATPPPIGGRFQPLSGANVAHVTETAFAILEKTGVSGAPEAARELALRNGAEQRADGRNTFPRALVEDMVAKACKRVELPSFKRDRGSKLAAAGCISALAARRCRYWRRGHRHFAIPRCRTFTG